LVLGTTMLFMNDGSGLRLSIENAQGKGNLTGSSGGAAISTVRDGTYNPGGSGSISILKAGAVTCGGITAARYQTSSSTLLGGSTAGSVQIGAAEDPVASVRVDRRSLCCKREGGWRDLERRCADRRRI
jgi:hypothetical protein